MAGLFGRRGGAADGEVPRDWRKALAKVLTRLDKGPVSLSGPVGDYVLTGSPVSALTMVASSHGAFRALGLMGPGLLADFGEMDQQLYETSGSVPPGVLLRWARVLGAVLGNQSYYVAFDPIGGGHWAEALLIQLTNVGSGQGHTLPAELPVDHELMERMLVLAGADPADLLVAGFRPGSRYGALQRRMSLRLLRGYEQAVRRHADALRIDMGVRRVENQLTALEMLGRLGPETLSPFAAELAQMATSTSGQVRGQAAAPIAKIDAVEPLKAIAATGKPEERLEALRLLWARDDAALKEWARDQAAGDRAGAVRALAAEWDKPIVDTQTEAAIVETPVIDWTVPVTDELRAQLLVIQQVLNRAIDSANAAHLAAQNRSQAQHGSANMGPYGGAGSRRFEDDDLATLVKALEAGHPPSRTDLGSGVSENAVGRLIASQLASPLLGPVGLTIMLNQLAVLFGHHSLTNLATSTYNALHAATGRPTLLELSTMLDQLGVSGAKLVFDKYSSMYGTVLSDGWPDEDVAPFVQANLELVTDALAPAPAGYYLTPTAAFRALATLPSTPPLVVDALFALALGSRKAERCPAQDALARVPTIGDRVVTALSDGKADVRTTAAQWLAQLDHLDAIPALEAAVKREKQDVPKGAMLDALEAFGQPVEKYLNRASLAKQASAGLAKGMHKDLAWLQWEAVPAVRWADTGDPVASEVLKWFASQAVKAKSPEPNAILRKYCALLDTRDREAFGQYLLEAWLAEDIRAIEPDEARRLAEQRAQRTQQSIASWPQHHQDDPLVGMSFQELTAHYLPGFMRQPAGSAIASKGLLAVAAACAGERAAAPVARYLKEWYGMRAAQGKALIGMLAWIEHPSATQLMLSVGSRFRTKSFQDEATKQAEALAERKGWTIGELADRTIPTAGFDESGAIELSYGDRTFTAVLLPDLTTELRSPEGKKVSSLPAPRQSDDEERAKESKKAYSLAKKELKAIVQLQTERLYEALCTERTWLFEDWQLYLNQHPVVRYLTQRLSWVATTADGATVVRPMDDGTLTDVDDEQVTLPPDAVIAIAHDSLLDDSTVQAWQQHLDDYEVAPLFQQFGKGTFTLAAENADARDSTDFTGHLLEAFALRGRAGKLGYTRGAAQDAGWFYEYEKRFPTLALTAVVEFTGNPLPEQNRTVALKALRFQRNVPGGTTVDLRLGEVPAVLLSEAYNDVRLMAADGSGFDPDWQKKSEY